MDELAASTIVYAPAEEIFDLLLDFSRFTRYAKHLTDVQTHGDGGAGTRYDLRFEWWKLSYTARSEVTAVDPPRRLDFRILEDIDAHGCWRVEPLDELPGASGGDGGSEVPDDTELGCRAWFEVAFDPGSVRAGNIDLPRLVSLDWVLKKLRPLVRAEAERVVERVVTDLEGRPRPVDVKIHDEAPEL